MSLNWFKKSTAEDERIVNLKNKLYKEVYTLIMIISTYPSSSNLLRSRERSPSGWKC